MSENNHNFGLPNNPFSHDGLSVSSPFNDPLIDNNQSNSTSPIGTPSNDLIGIDTNNTATTSNDLQTGSSANNSLLEENTIDTNTDILTGSPENTVLVTTEENDSLVNGGSLDLEQQIPAANTDNQDTQILQLGSSTIANLPTISVLNGIINAELTQDDAINPTPRNSNQTYYSDDYQLINVQAGKAVSIKLSAEFDAYLQLVNADTGEVINYNDDGLQNYVDSFIAFIPESSINYLVRVSSYNNEDIGVYTVNTNEIPEIALETNNTYEYLGKIKLRITIKRLVID